MVVRRSVASSGGMRSMHSIDEMLGKLRFVCETDNRRLSALRDGW